MSKAYPEGFGSLTKRYKIRQEEITMICRKLSYIVTLAACALLPLAGCSGGGSSAAKLTEKGTEVTVGGNVDTGKSTAKSVELAAGDMNSVTAYDAQAGTALGTATIASDGSFSGLTFTLPSTKAIIVFKATVAQGVFRSVVPIDLSSPPAAGTVVGSNPISIVISQESNNTAAMVSGLLGLSGMLGDPGMTLASVNKTYTDAAQIVINNGGQQLAYSGSGLALTGKFTSQAMLPALDANNLSVDQLNNMTLNGAITGVSIPGNYPIVSFYVTNAATGKGIRGLKSFGLAIAQLKPENNGSPTEWLSYMIHNLSISGSSAGTYSDRPSTDNGTYSATYPNNPVYTIIDNGDGSYTAKFGKDIKGVSAYGVTYDANLTHRLVVQVRTTPSVALLQNGSTLSNFYNELILGTTFVPATPGVAPTVMRDITTTAACNECHTKIGVTTPHGGRGETKYCMVCHTAQRANGQATSTSTAGAFAPIERDSTGKITSANTYVADGEVSGEFVTMIHKIHMGSKLTKTNYNYAGVLFNDIVYPKEITNCRQCHKGDDAGQLALAPQANNWKEKPSRKSCGACHDNINFATGANLKAGGAAHPAQANDSFCVSCHGTAGPYPVESFHTTVNATLNNPNVATGLVNFFYEISGVTVNGSNQAVIRFRIRQNTGSLTAAKTDVVFNGSGANPLVGFTGSPGFLLAYTQDGSPDFTNMGHTGKKAAQPISVSIANLLDGTKGTLVADGATGYYNATITAAASNFPANATMRTVGLQGYFTQISPAAARHALSVMKTVTDDTVRRNVIDSEKCGNCHEWFEGHGGSRVIGKGTGSSNAAICVMCHVPGLSTSGRGADANLINFIITNPVGTSFNTVALLNPVTGLVYSTTGTISQEAKDAMNALNAALGMNPTTYPEATNNFKDMIHGIHSGTDSLVVGQSLKFVRDRTTSGDFGYDFGFVKFPGVLKNCGACHAGTTYTSIPDKAQVSTIETSNGTVLTPANNVVTVDAARKSLPNATDLVTTPFAATCVSCHSKPNAVAHIKQMGGQIKVLRSLADPAGEACVTCHGSTGPNALWNVHRFTTQGE